VIGGEAEGHSLGVKSHGWNTSYDYALISVYRITPEGLWLRSSDYTAQKQRVMGLSVHGGNGAAESVLIIASADRLAADNRGAADEPLATFDQLRMTSSPGTASRYSLLVGQPDRKNRKACEVLSSLERGDHGIRLVTVPTAGSLPPD
jgi:hypothetical protein